jgi:RNA polymerase sigma-32 factor
MAKNRRNEPSGAPASKRKRASVVAVVEPKTTKASRDLAHKSSQDAAEESQENDALEAELVEPGEGSQDAELTEQDDGPQDAELVEVDDSYLAEPVETKQQDGSSSLARYDALQAYMRDVHRYNVLDAEDQRQLAIRYRESGDVEAAAKLVTSNLRLVVKIAYDYRRAYRNVMDLIQEGNIGLMQAVKKYDPYKGVKLSSYAAWWIRAYILRFILNNWRLVKLGTTQAQRKLFFNLSKEKARLTAMGIEPTTEAIAQSLEVSEEEVTNMDRRLSAGEMSLDAPAGGPSDDGRTQSRVDFLPGLGGRVDELLADEELARILHQELASFGETLAGKERRIFYERLVAEDPRTLQELGTDFGVSRERVRQLEKRLQEKLKVYLEERLGTEMLEP